MKTHLSTSLITLLYVLTLAGCSSESGYDLKEVDGGLILLNKQTGSLSGVRSGKVVPLLKVAEEDDDSDRPVKDMGTLVTSYDKADGSDNSLKMKLKDGTLYYKVSIKPNPVGKPFGKQMRAYLESLENPYLGAAPIAIIFRDKDEFKIAEVEFPKLRRVGSTVVKEQGADQSAMVDVSVPAEYIAEGSCKISAHIYDQIQSWETHTVKAQQQ